MRKQFRTKAVLTLAALLFVVGAINGSLQAGTIVYEPFDYPVPPDLNYGTQFNGTPVGAGTGLTGTWTATTGIYHAFAGYKCTIDSPTLSYGILPVAGAKLRLTVNSGASAYASIDTANLAGRLDDGDEIWFSAITSVSLGSPNGIVFKIGTDDGNSLGWALKQSSGTVVQAASWVNGTKTVAPASPVQVSAVSLVVGKITFGETDTVDVYLPDTNLTLGSPVATISAALDQSTFGFLKIQGGSGISHWIDELRIGETYDDLIGGKHAYWDLNGSTAGSGGPTPGGTWNAVDPNWNDSGNGAGTGTVAWAAGGQIAAFAAGTDATGPYAVTVEGTRDIGGLKFSKGTVTLSAGAGANLRMVRDSKVYVESGLTATVQAPISDDGSARGLGLSGPGTLVLSGDNTYTGATIVPVGTLVLSGNNVAATGGMNITGGVARFESPASINGTLRNVTVNYGGTVVFGPSFGDANIPAALSGRIAASSTGAIAADNYAGTNFDFSAAGLTGASLGAVGSVTYTGTLTPNGTTYRLGGGGGTLTMNNANAVTGAGNSLVVNGPGTVVLSAANNYDGGTTLRGGTLVVADAAALGTGTVAVTGTSTIRSGVSATVPLATINSDVICTLDPQGNTMRLDRAVTGGGGLFLTGTGTLLVANNGALGTGTFTITSAGAALAAEGTIVTTTPFITYSDVTIGGTGSLTLGTLTFNDNPRTITNNNTVGTTTFGAITANGNKALIFSGNGNTTATGAIALGTAGLTKNGTGTLTLSGNSTYTGATKVNAGTLAASILANGGSNSSIGKSTNAAGSLVFGAPTATLRYTGSSNVTINRSFTLSSGAGGGATIESSGSGTLSIDNTIPLAYGTGAQTRLLTLGGTNTGANTFSKVIANNTTAATSLTKTGAGTWILSGASTYTGATTINDGMLLINGSTAAGSAVAVNAGTLGGIGTIGGAVSLAGGTLAPGNRTLATPAAGTLMINNAVDLTGGATEMRLFGPTDSDKLVQSTTGSLTYGGILKIVDLDPGDFAVGNNWDLFDFTGQSGTFSNNSEFGTAGGTYLPALTSDKKWVFNYANGMLSIDVAFLPGDTNGDKIVDAADFITLKKNFGTASGATWEMGNFSDPYGTTGTVDWADLNILTNAMAGTGGSQAVTPEPATLGLLAIGALAVLRKRRNCSEL
jgi:autotransporter-associated beta strand protein